jgi:hypothetical protein
MSVTNPRERVLALHKREPKLGATEIARRLDLDSRHVWAVLNPDRVAASNKRRRAAKQEWSRRRYVHPCESCGTSINRRHKLCRGCLNEDWRRERTERWKRIAKMIHDGLTNAQIGKALGLSKSYVATEITAARQEGFDMPRRNDGWGEGGV